MDFPHPTPTPPPFDRWSPGNTLATSVSALRKELESASSVSTSSVSASATSTSSPRAITVYGPSSTGYYGPYPSGPSSQGYYGTRKEDQSVWEDLPRGGQVGVIVGCIVIVIIIVLLSMWCCCGCCGGRTCGKRKRIPTTHDNPGAVPLHTIQRGGDGGAIGGDLPPPQYEEVAPPQHQTIAGGISHIREEDEGIISDGKTPLSEIPFEDVVLDHSGSSASGSGSPARAFVDHHHGFGGDTRGHTNS